MINKMKSCRFFKISISAVLLLFAGSLLFHQKNGPKGASECFQNSTTVQFQFSPLKLTQGCEAGDLPFHFFLHPDDKNAFRIKNPGVSTYSDFIAWAGAGFPSDSKDAEIVAYGGVGNKDWVEKGLKHVKYEAERQTPPYQTILAGYFFYSGETKSGLYWAEKGAEAGETGSMKILGDAYTYGIGIVPNDIEGMKWYMIASSLGNLAAMGDMLAKGPLVDDSSENHQKMTQANQLAQDWMNTHRTLFISNS